ncbi:MAG: hypothetical protein ABI158_00275, partial [Edaphobacter sp.]
SSNTLNKAHSSSSNNSETEAHNTTTSTAATLVASKSDSSNSSDVYSDHVTNNIQGALSIGSAEAQNIAVDGSTLTATNNSSINLSGTAEQNATAINLVNAASSMVANGVNIARTTGMNATPTLTQSNSISQSH